MIYILKQPWHLLWFKGKWIGRISNYLWTCRLITKAAVHRWKNNCSANFRKFLGKELRWSTILVKVQAFTAKFYPGQLLLNLHTILIVSTHSCLPYLYVRTKRGGRVEGCGDMGVWGVERGGWFKILCWRPLSLTMHWRSRNTLT